MFDHGGRELAPGPRAHAVADRADRRRDRPRRAARRRRRGRAGGGRGGRGRAGHRHRRSPASPRPACCSTSTGDPVVPAIAWHDARGEDEAARLAGDLPGFSARVGLPASALCTLAKYRWMREHLPESERGVRWLNVAEWIVLGLGGEPAAELSLASRTGFYDLHERRPWDEALAWAGAPAGPDARRRAGRHPDGHAPILPEARGAVLTVGGHDHLAAAVGAGAAGEGDVLDSCGTAEAFVRAERAARRPSSVARAVAGGISVGWHAVAGPPGAARRALVRAPSCATCSPASASSPSERAPDRGRRARARGRAAARTRAARRPRRARASPAAAYRRRARRRRPRRRRRSSPAWPPSPAPARRLVVTGGWAAGAAARAVKERHLGAVRALPRARSPAARAAARSPLAGGGAVVRRRRAVGRGAGGDAEWPSRCSRRAGSSRASAACARCVAPSFTVNPGEVVALIGDNGAGKSTLDQDAVGRPRTRTTARSSSRAGR